MDPPTSSSVPKRTYSEPTEFSHYYYGLPSWPKLVARSSTWQWENPTGPEAYSRIKQLRTVGKHAVLEIWEDSLAPKVQAVLASKEVQWTSIDIVRLGWIDESFYPVVLWIGVTPASLSREDGRVVVSECMELLKDFDISDVEVEIRDSVVTLLAGPKLLKPLESRFDPTIDLREPLSTTLGLPICAQPTPWAEGTGGFFIFERGKPERLLLVTARHVVFPPDKDKNELFHHKHDSQPRHLVRLFGDAAFQKYLRSIQDGIRSHSIMVDYHERCIKRYEGKDDPESNRARDANQVALGKAKRAGKEVRTFYDNVKRQWGPPESRILGHVILSPPLDTGVGSQGYTEDWAIIEIDPSKVDANNLKGNVIELPARIEPGEFVRMMSPDLRSFTCFEYPVDRRVELQGTISDEARHPTACDEYGNPCLMVLKRGSGTGLTVGRANGLCSYTRNYLGDGNFKISKERCILPVDDKSGAFAEQGDSGSVIVDGQGRIFGLLTGGAGTMSTRTRSSVDINFATPVDFLLDRIQSNGTHEPSINLPRP